MFRQRVTVTLDPSLVEAADILVDGATVRSRSHAFEVLMHEGLGLSNLDTLVVITEDSWAAAALTQLIALLQGITWKQAHLVSSSNLPDTNTTSTPAHGHHT